MLTIEIIDTRSKAQVQQFVNIPYRMYQGHSKWVPPILLDARMQLNRDKHPFYEHSDADFFIAMRAGKPVGRIGALINNRYNEYHDAKTAQFYLFECENDQEVASELFARVFEWAKERGMTRMIGPKGFGALDGYGFLVDGYEHRQLMNMTNYNFDYYPSLVEPLGFTKEVDFVSYYIHAASFKLPEKVHRIANRIKERGTLRVHNFKSKRDLRDWAPRIGKTYNETFVNNWEYSPLTEKEIQFLLDSILTVADHRLIKIIVHGEQVVGFLLGFSDLSAAMQRARGRLFPFGLIDLLLEMRRTNWIALNGAGVLPQFQGRGGNALLYAEIENTLTDYNFEHADLTQVAESAVMMTRDLTNLGGKPYKRHRVYTRNI